MRVLPDSSNIEAFDALVIRTDYGDEQAWQAVKAALAEPVRIGGEVRSYTAHIVDDSSWAGATVDEVLAAVAGHLDYLSVVFLADLTTMQAGHHALLAVTNAKPGEEYYEAMTEFGREFRTVPAGAHEIHTNLTLYNMDFNEFSAAAHRDPDGVFRSWWLQHG
jgi:hypothetical protein